MTQLSLESKILRAIGREILKDPVLSKDPKTKAVAERLLQK
jgi:hypothetical protein